MAGCWHPCGGHGCLPALPPGSRAERGSGSRGSPGDKAQERSSPEQLARKLRPPDACWQLEQPRPAGRPHAFLSGNREPGQPRGSTGCRTPGTWGTVASAASTFNKQNRAEQLRRKGLESGYSGRLWEERGMVRRRGSAQGLRAAPVCACELLSREPQHRRPRLHHVHTQKKRIDETDKVNGHVS